MAKRRVALSPELKKAISDLPSREKDKLLFRLLPKENALVAKLEYELLEAGDNVAERRNDLAREITSALQRSAANFYSPGYILLDLRAWSGEITRHVKTTKDKYGEVKLNFLLLNEGIGNLTEQINANSAGRARTLNEYVVKRTLKLFSLMRDLHADHRLDFREEMKTLGKNIGSIDSMMREAIREGLDVNYLLKGEIQDYEV